MDVAELGYRIDSTDADKATRSTRRLTDEARKADAVFAGLRTRALALGSGLATAFSLNRAIDGALSLSRATGELSTLLPGATSELNNMRDAARDLRREFGTDQATQISAFYQAVSAGATDAASATELVRSANQLAIGGAAGLAESINVLNAATNAYADEMLSAADASDILFTGVKTGVTTISQLSGSMGRLIPAASAVGLGFDEAVGGVAALTTQGQETNIAVTSLAAALNVLLNPSQQAREEARLLGIEFNAAKLQAMGLAGFMEYVVEAADGNQEALARLFGSAEALRAVFAFAGQGGVKLAEIMDDMANRTGAAREAFEDQESRLHNQWARAMTNAGEIVVDLGTSLLTILAPAAEYVTRLMLGLEEPTLALEVAMKAAAVTAGALLAVRLYGLITAFLATSPAVASAVMAFRAYVASIALVGPVSATATVATTALGAAIRFALGPIGLLITGVSLITAAWVKFGDAINPAEEAQARMNSLVRESTELTNLATVATEDAARANLEQAMAIRERMRAEIESTRNLFREEYASGDILGITDMGAALRDAEKAFQDNEAAIESLRQRIVQFGRDAAESETARAAAQDAAFTGIIERLNAEHQAMTFNRAEGEARLAILSAQLRLERQLTPVEEEQLRLAIERNRLRSEEIQKFDEITRSLYEYTTGLTALNGLMAQGAITAEEYWDQVLNMRLPEAAAQLDAYLRQAGAAMEPLRLQVEMAEGNTDQQAFNNMMQNPALAGQGSEIERLRQEYVEREVLLQQMRQADIINEQEYQSRLTALRQASAQERVDLEQAAYATQLAAASTAFDAIAQATKGLAGEQSGVYKAMFAVSKAFAIAESIINIQRAMSQALALPFPANIPAMAAVAAEGASIVSAIQAVAGFRGGGFTGNGPLNEVSGVVHGQEGVIRAQAMQGIGKDALAYMNRYNELPPREPSQGGETKKIINDFRGALVTRDAVEELDRRINSVGDKVESIDGSIERRVDEHEQAKAERGYY